MILKQINNLLVKLLRFSVCLSLSGQLLLLPYIHFSRAHLHIINGVIVAHWHISKGLSEKNPDRKTPLAEHNHPFVEIFNLWGVGKIKCTPVSEYHAVLFITCEIDLAPLSEEKILNQTTTSFPSGRSPPAFCAV